MSKLPKIFIAYAREDKPLLQKLRTHLNVMKRQQHCEIFFDGEIMPGEPWDKRLKDELHAAHVFVLLVTAEFLDSDYVNETELPKILERRAKGEAEVVAVVLKDCLWDLTELQHLQVVLHEGKPIDKNDAYAFAAREVFRVIEGRNEKLKKIAEVNVQRFDAQRRTTEQEKQPKPDKVLGQRMADHARRLEAQLTAKLNEKQDKPTYVLGQRAADDTLRRNFHDLMLPIKGGSFKMGDEHGDLKISCRPIHEVTIKDFYLCKHPVTQAQWRAIMGDPLSDGGPSWFKGDDLPLEYVSWDDAQDFLKNLNKKTGENYRLPSEAEWEYAARGGLQSKNFKYAGSDNLDEVAWHISNSNQKTQPVMQKKANELGLYDLNGNVWEWCQDVWHNSYLDTPKDGSAWISGGDQIRRVVRGGLGTTIPIIVASLAAAGSYLANMIVELASALPCNITLYQRLVTKLL